MDAQVNAPVRIQVNEVAQNEPRRAGNEGADAPSGSLFDVRDPNLEPIIQYAIGMAGLDAVLAAPADTFAGTEVAAAFSLSFQRWGDCTKAEAAAGTIITAATAADVEATFEDLCQAFAAAGLEDNSSATAALAALKEYTVAYPTFHTNIHVGSVVVMAGLKARTDLNGTIGVVLEERGERWSIFSIADESQSIGNIKQANLTALPHPDTVGKSTEAATSREGTALLLAIGQARMEAFRALLPVSDINKVAETFRIDASCVKGAESKLDAKLMCWMRSPLMLAAQMKSTDMVRLEESQVAQICLFVIGRPVWKSWAGTVPAQKSSQPISILPWQSKGNSSNIPWTPLTRMVAKSKTEQEITLVESRMTWTVWGTVSDIT